MTNQRVSVSFVKKRNYLEGVWTWKGGWRWEGELRSGVPHGKVTTHNLRLVKTLI